MPPVVLLPPPPPDNYFTVPKPRPTVRNLCEQKEAGVSCEQAILADFVCHNLLVSCDDFTHFQQHNQQADLPCRAFHNALPGTGNDLELF